MDDNISQKLTDADVLQEDHHQSREPDDVSLHSLSQIEEAQPNSSAIAMGLDASVEDLQGLDTSINPLLEAESGSKSTEEDQGKPAFTPQSCDSSLTQDPESMDNSTNPLLRADSGPKICTNQDEPASTPTMPEIKHKAVQDLESMDNLTNPLLKADSGPKIVSNQDEPASTPTMPEIKHEAVQEINGSELCFLTCCKSNATAAMRSLEESQDNKKATAGLIQSKDDSNNTPLHLAADSGHDELIKKLLASKAKVNAQNNKGYTPLHMAVLGGRIETTKLLLGEGNAKVNASCNEGKTALHLAAEYAFVHILKELLTSKRINLNSKDKQGNTALHVAAKKGVVDILEVLTTANGINLSSKNKEGNTALHLAIASPAFEVSADQQQIIVTKIADALKSPTLFSPSSLDAQNNLGFTPLHEAVRKQRVNLVKTLVQDHKANIAKVDKIQKQTPIHLALSGAIEASKEMRLELINELLFGETQQRRMIFVRSVLDIQDVHGKTALHLAIDTGHFDVVEKLFALCKPSLKKRQREHYYTPLHLAVSKGTGDKIDDKDNKTNIYKIVSFLLDQKADPNIQASMYFPDYRESVLHTACGISKNESIVAKLIENRANIGMKDLQGNTALHKAANKAQCFYVLTTLIKNGADLNVKNYEEQAPLNLLKQGDNSQDFAKATFDLLVLIFNEGLELSYDAGFSKDSKSFDAKNLGPVQRYFVVICDSLGNTSDSSEPITSQLTKECVNDVLNVCEVSPNPLFHLVQLAASLTVRGKKIPLFANDMLALKAKVLQLAEVAIRIPEMDNIPVALKVFGKQNAGSTYSIQDECSFVKKGLLAIATTHRLGEIISRPQAQRAYTHVWGAEELIKSLRDWDWPLTDRGSENSLTRLWSLQMYRTVPVMRAFSCFVLHMLLLINVYWVLWSAPASEAGLLPKHISLLVLVAGMFVQEISQLQDPLYSQDVWNIWDWLIILMFIGWAVLGLKYVQYDDIAQILLALNTFFILFRTLHFLTVFEQVGTLVDILLIMMGDLLQFFVLWAVLLWGFTVVFGTLFPDLPAFASFSHTFLFLFSSSIGGFDLTVFDESEKRTLGTVLLCVYLTLAYVMAMNMLIAMLSTTYAEHTENRYREWCLLFANFVTGFYVPSAWPDCLSMPGPLCLLDAALFPLTFMGKHVDPIFGLNASVIVLIVDTVVTLCLVFPTFIVLFIIVSLHSSYQQIMEQFYSSTWKDVGLAIFKEVTKYKKLLFPYFFFITCFTNGLKKFWDPLKAHMMVKRGWWMSADFALPSEPQKEGDVSGEHADANTDGVEEEWLKVMRKALKERLVLHHGEEFHQIVTKLAGLLKKSINISKSEADILQHLKDELANALSAQSG